MDTPRPEAITEVRVDAPEIETSIDLDGLGLFLNNASRDGWIALSDALSKEHDYRAFASTFDLEPGADLQTLNLVLGAGIGGHLGEDFSGPPGTACVVLFVAEPMTPQMAIHWQSTMLLRLTT